MGELEPLLLRAVAAAWLAAVASGVVGSLVYVRRIGAAAGGIAHAVLAGVGIAAWSGTSPLTGSLAAAVAAALVIWIAERRLPGEADVAIAAVWSAGMAIGLLFIARTPGWGAGLADQLFGNVLLVAPRDLQALAMLDAVVVVLVACMHRELVAVAFDEEFVRLRGLHAALLHLLLLVLVALTVVVLVRVVGLVLVVALLMLPAAIAARLVATVRAMMPLAIVLSGTFASAGIGLAWHWDLPTGACIILVTSVAWAASVVLRGARRRGRPHGAAA